MAFVLNRTAQAGSVRQQAGTRRTHVVVSCQQGASRRQMLAATAGATLLQAFGSNAALAGGLPPQEIKVLCNADCEAKIANAELVTLPSGLQYRDILPGRGPSPKVGFQVTCNYVAMTPNMRVFDSSIDKGKPYDIRVGAGQVIPGLDEGLLTMKTGGLRRLYIPGDLAFPKGLKAAAGRPSVPPASPVVFDVELLYIPGIEADDEE